MPYFNIYIYVYKRKCAGVLCVNSNPIFLHCAAYGIKCDKSW